MASPHLIDYINQNIDAKKTKQKIVAKLEVKQNWPLLNNSQNLTNRIIDSSN